MEKDRNGRKKVCNKRNGKCRRGKNAAQKVRFDPERFCRTSGLFQTDCRAYGT